MSKKKQEENHELNAPMAYIQAVNMLAIARKFALERKDPIALIDIANSWIEIGNNLLTHEVELEYNEDDDPVVTVQAEIPFQVGFTGGIDGEKETESSPDSPQD